MAELKGGSTVGGELIASKSDVVAKVFRAYMSANYAKSANAWSKLPINTVLFNTIGGTFDTANYRFTANRAGYYQISTTGYATSGGSGSERYAFSVYKNGSPESIWGGNYSAVDCPFASGTTILYMNGTTDYIEIWSFSALALTYSGGSGQYGVQWHMSYLGE